MILDDVPPQRADVREVALLRLLEIAQHGGGRHDGRIVVGEPEPARRARLPLFGDLGLFAQDKDGLAEGGRFFLHAAGIRDHEKGVLEAGEELLVIERLAEDGLRPVFAHPERCAAARRLLRGFG